MPLEIVELKQTPDAPYETIAQAMSVVAYPYNSVERQRFWHALCRTIIEWRLEPTGSMNLVLMRVAHFQFDSAVQQRILLKGVTVLNRRLLTVRLLVAPHVGAKNARQVERINGHFPTVDSMAIFLKETFDMTGENTSSFKTKIWKPTKSVAHVVLAYLIQYLDKEEDWSKHNELFESAEEQRKFFRFAESLKSLIQDVRQFRIRPDDFIEFRC